MFGGELLIDVMFLEGDAVQHIVNTETLFSAAKFWNKNGATCRQTVEEIWLAFVTNCFFCLFRVSKLIAYRPKFCIQLSSVKKANRFNRNPTQIFWFRSTELFGNR